MNLESKFFGIFVGFKVKAVSRGAFELLSQKRSATQSQFQRSALDSRAAPHQAPYLPHQSLSLSLQFNGDSVFFQWIFTSQLKINSLFDEFNHLLWFFRNTMFTSQCILFLVLNRAGIIRPFRLTCRKRLFCKKFFETEDNSQYEISDRSDRSQIVLHSIWIKNEFWG